VVSGSTCGVEVLLIVHPAHSFLDMWTNADGSLEFGKYDHVIVMKNPHIWICYIAKEKSNTVFIVTVSKHNYHNIVYG